MSISNRLRGFNFFYFSLFALFLSFLPVYGAKIGISETNIGFIMAVASLISIFSQPLWGMVSDRFRTIRKVLLLLIAVGIVFGTLLYRSSELWGYAGLVALMYFFFLPTDPLMESLNYQTSQRERVSFGSVRMFGALGFAVASLSAGYVSREWGMSSLAWVFLGFGIITLLLGTVLKDVPASPKAPAFHHLKAFFTQSHAWLFFLLVLVVSISHKMNDLFIGLYMQRLGGGDELTGWAWFMMTAAETLFFGLSARWIKPGREVVFMTVAAALYAVRFLLSSVIGNPYALVALQVFQGVTFVFFYVAAIQYLHRIVPEQWKSTGQTVLTVVFFGVSGIVGSTLGGWLIDEFGGAVLYRSMAGFATLGFALFCIYLLPRHRREEAG